jgi:glycosyltransferase involved in cell wall biosynthesis
MADAGQKRLRVALVHSFYSSQQPSGENAQVRAEMDALQRAGFDARLFAANTDDREHESLYRVRSALRVATGRGLSPLRELDAFAPHVVHVHNLFPNFGRWWITDLQAPVVVTLHNFRFSCANGMLFRDGRVCTDCVEGTRWSGLRHRCYRNSSLATLPLVLSQRGGPTADPVLARADRILCLTPRQRQMLERAGIPADRLVDWSNFLPSELDPGPARAAGARDGAICVSRMSSEKGVLELVETWDGDIQLTVVGDGPQLGEVRGAATGRNVDVLGRVDRTRALDLMTRSAAFIMPGTWPEVAPLTYVEALASGLPVVVLASSDIAQRVRTEGTGEVIGAVDEAPGAAAQVGADPTLPARCRQVYERRYTEALWRGRLIDLYAGLTNGAHAR